MPASLERADWLIANSTRAVFDALDGEGGRTRIVGGAVRDALLGRPVMDIDMATEFLPEIASERASAAGLKVVPTGIDHGTITVVAHGVPIEVTTLRADVDTFGRHAAVEFTTDWQQDAERRDFTINALYCAASGAVFDPVGGESDLFAGKVRFIGSPEDRIREDYLRILRFFRFTAWYGKGRPDADGLKACAVLRSGLKILSAERVWAEIKRLLSAPDPIKSVLWMRTTEILSEVLPEHAGTDLLHKLVAKEPKMNLRPDPLLRLAALISPKIREITDVAGRLRLSGKEKSRLEDWANAPEADPALSNAALAQRLYRHGVTGVRDRIVLAIAAIDETDLVDRLQAQLAYIGNWERPEFPIKGRDLVQIGVAQGREMGEILKGLENRWVEAGFTPNREELLAWVRSGNGAA